MTADAADERASEGGARSAVPVTRRAMLGTVAVSGLPVSPDTTSLIGGGNVLQANTAKGYGEGGYGLGPYGGVQSSSGDDEVTARFDSDGDGEIEFSEVIGGISAFNSGETRGGEPVTFEDVIALIAAFNRDSAESG